MSSCKGQWRGTYPYHNISDYFVLQTTAMQIYPDIRHLKPKAGMLAVDPRPWLLTVRSRFCPGVAQYSRSPGSPTSLLGP